MAEEQKQAAKLSDELEKFIDYSSDILGDSKQNIKEVLAAEKLTIHDFKSDKEDLRALLADLQDLLSTRERVRLVNAATSYFQSLQQRNEMQSLPLAHAKQHVDTRTNSNVKVLVRGSAREKTDPMRGDNRLTKYHNNAQWIETAKKALGTERFASEDFEGVSVGYRVLMDYLDANIDNWRHGKDSREKFFSDWSFEDLMEFIIAEEKGDNAQRAVRYQWNMKSCYDCVAPVKYMKKFYRRSAQSLNYNLQNLVDHYKGTHSKLCSRMRSNQQ